MTNTQNIQIGDAVQYELDGEVIFFGTAAMLTDAWVSIRQADGRVDDAPRSHTVVDPT